MYGRLTVRPVYSSVYIPIEQHPALFQAFASFGFRAAVKNSFNNQTLYPIKVFYTIYANSVFERLTMRPVVSFLYQLSKPLLNFKPCSRALAVKIRPVAPLCTPMRNTPPHFKPYMQSVQRSAQSRIFSTSVWKLFSPFEHVGKSFLIAQTQVWAIINCHVIWSKSIPGE